MIRLARSFTPVPVPSITKTCSTFAVAVHYPHYALTPAFIALVRSKRLQGIREFWRQDATFISGACDNARMCER